MLSCTHRLLVSSLLLMAVLSCTVDASEPKPTPKQIAQWIEQLSDNDFKTREDASKKLWQAGAAAESALEKAIKRDDPEAARRARELLEKFHWGIYPDTPADVVALIRAYQTSEVNPRLEVLQKLLSSGEPGLRAFQKIASFEKDENLRKVLGDLVVNKVSTDFLLCVTEGKYEQFERLLELAHEGKFIDNNTYAVYWLLRGRLLQRIVHFRDRLNEHPKDEWVAETVAYLHRANGDLVAARKTAEKTNRPELLESILYELGDWKALAARGKLHFFGAKNSAENWAYRAAFARLAGQPKEFESALQELRKCTENKQERDSLPFPAAKGLLLNDKPAEGLQLLRTVPEQHDMLFDILCARLDFAAAMDLAVKEGPIDKEDPSLAFARARLLCQLGDKEGETLFDRYAERIKDEIDPYWVRSLLRQEMRAGLKDRAFVHAAKALGVALPKNSVSRVRDRLYLEQLFPQKEMTAEVWWTVLHRRFKGESPETALKRLRNLLEGKVAATEVKAWIEANPRPPAATPPDDAPLRATQVPQQALAEVALLAGLDDLASSLLKKADNRDALLRLGDLCAAKKQWNKAAEHYRQAWTKELQAEVRNADPKLSRFVVEKRFHDPLPLYLAGDALVRAGRETEGKKLIEQAHWVPLADAENRYHFLRALLERGHHQAARRETELLLCVSEPNTIAWTAATHRLAVAALARKDYFKAAEGTEQTVLVCLNTTVNFVEKAAFANVPAQIHQLHASGLIADGKLNQALKHVELALADSPGSVELATALVPELERRGHKKEATDLYNRVYESWEKVCRRYPRCAWAHNQAAWMSACCRRNLDAALRHAEKAVELSPTYAGYLDTLAEIHFQRGNKDKAITLQKRAIELNPRKAYYRKQLKRLEVGDPNAERPSENDE